MLLQLFYLFTVVTSASLEGFDNTYKPESVIEESDPHEPLYGTWKSASTSAAFTLKFREGKVEYKEGYQKAEELELDNYVVNPGEYRISIIREYALFLIGTAKIDEGGENMRLVVDSFGSEYKRSAIAGAAEKGEEAGMVVDLVKE